ncbi:MAG: CDP-alcohol phosphatidyltransferase family protein [Rhizobiaceae bacterium]|nr:CDP-alcohol phosphatidyltransferase family protein [Rhizobiaceae bacterium]
MTIANLITLVRIMLVPVIVWAALSGQMLMAFLLFLLAGASDAIDGTVARYFNQQTELGTILDPIADKLMLVCVFISLAYLGSIPLWLVILIVSRDLLIIFGVLLAFFLSLPVTIRPLWISKTNTAVQIILAAWVLFSLAFGIDWPNAKTSLEWLTGLLTALSAAAYTYQGIKLFATSESGVR